jgi:DNA-binding NtrC family response regulator
VHGRPLGDDEEVLVGVGDDIELGAVPIRLAAVSGQGRAVPPSAAQRNDRRALGSGRALLDVPESWYVASSPAMRRVQDAIEQVAPSDVSVLILGETGVGKEICAEQIHRRSTRAHGTLLRLNCSAIPESLIESELFGHDRGAFTGATSPKPGLIESADGGTVFLDEIGELSMTVQAKLLRVLDRREVIRLGEIRPRTVNTRFIAATHRSLDAEIAAGRFRQDLLYRLAGMTIRIPPLRERLDELQPLAERFVADAARRFGRPTPRISESASAAIARHGWPGNIRELRNVMERAVLVCTGAVIEAPDISFVERNERPTIRLPQPSPTGLRAEVEALERVRIIGVLDECNGNRSEAARRLGMSRGALLARLRAWGKLDKKTDELD